MKTKKKETTVATVAPKTNKPKEAYQSQDYMSIEKMQRKPMGWFSGQLLEAAKESSKKGKVEQAQYYVRLVKDAKRLPHRGGHAARARIKRDLSQGAAL